MRRCIPPLFALLLVASLAIGQDAPVANLQLAVSLEKSLANIPPSAAIITVTPSVAEDRYPIVAELSTEIPTGAKVYGNGWTCSDGVRTVPVDTTLQYIWADPGEHTISYNGFWVHTEKIEIVDSAGNKRTIESLLAMGLIDTKATFTVKGKADPPNPPDPPVPPVPAALSVLLSYEAGDQTSVDPAQADILTDPVLRAYLDAHCTKVDGQPAWRFLDLSDDDGSSMPSSWQTVIARTKGKATPWLIIDNGKATYEGPCPKTAAEMLTKLKQYGGE